MALVSSFNTDNSLPVTTVREAGDGTSHTREIMPTVIISHA